jgi:ABC-type lipoprotein export system ATPase subunit
MAEGFGFKSVAFKNFRGIARGEIKDFNKINVLLGKFGAGKSTILESIYLPIITISDHQNELYNIFVRRTNREGHYGEALYKYDANQVASISYTIGLNTLELLIGKKETLQETIGGSLAVRVTFNRNRMGAIGYRDNLGYTAGGASGFDNPTFTFLNGLRLIDNKYKNTIQSIETQFLNPMRQRNLDEEFIELVMDVFDDVKNFEFLEYAPGTNQFRAVLKLEDSKVFVDDISDGLRHGLIILATAFMVKDTALLLEEPENHLYPNSLAKIIEKLVEISRKNNVQLFVSTHRPEVVANFVKFGVDDVKIFYVEKHVGNMTARPSEWNDVRILLDLGLDAGLLAKGFEKYVVVDGTMDKTILEFSIKKEKGVRAEDLWLTIIPARGDTNRKEIVKALIPTGKDIIIFKDMDEHSKEDTVKAVIDSIRELGNEGYDFRELDDRIEIQKQEAKYAIPKKNIYPIGIERLTYDGRELNLSKHAVDDYVLEIIINNYEVIGFEKTQLDYAVSGAESSKDILEKIMQYRSEEVQTLIEKSSLGTSLKALVTAITS